MQIGIIGTGTMGGMLATAFATWSNMDVSVFNRSLQKAERLVQAYPKIRIRQDAADVADEADVTFICTKASDGATLAAQIGPRMRPEQTVVTTISSIPLATWETWTPARTAIAIPSITQTERSGILLVCYGSRFDEPSRSELSSILSNISTPFAVCEEQIRITSDLTSCGPAFLSSLMLEWAAASARTGLLTAGDAEYLLSRTLVGVADLIKSGLAFRDITHKVCVPGGVTEAGVASLGKRAPALFDGVHVATRSHHHAASLSSGIAQLNHTCQEEDEGESC